jgi:hypothetical protein
MRCRRRGGKLVLVVVIALWPMLAVDQTKAKPLTEDEVIDLLQHYVAPARVADLARKEGIDFTLTPANEKQLSRAGADAALIKTLRELASKAATSQAQPTPIIQSFTAKPQRIEPGQQVDLRWSVSNADEVIIEPGIGKVEPSGLRLLYPATAPTSSQSYTLYARGPGGSQQQTLRVEVTVPQAQPEPVITFFTADPTSVERAGGSAKLAWSVIGATEITIEPGIGRVDNAGDRYVFPTQTTTYALRAKGNGASLLRQVTVEVAAPTDMAAVTAQAKERYASKDYAAAATLFRQAAEGGNVDAMGFLGYLMEHGLGVNADPSGSVVWYKKAAESGNVVAMLNLGTWWANNRGEYSEAIIWYRKAADAGSGQAMAFLGLLYEQGRGVATDLNEAIFWYRKAVQAGYKDAQNSLQRLGGDQPAINSFTAEPAMIVRGQGTTLRWRASNATSVTIEPALGEELGEVDPEGSRTVFPTSSQDYTLYARGAGGSQSSQVLRVEVTAPHAKPEPVILSFTAQPQRVERGQQVNLRWSVVNADEVAIEPGIGRVEPSGIRLLYPTELTYYQLTARGPGGSKDAAVEVTVNDPKGGRTPHRGTATAAVPEPETATGACQGTVTDTHGKPRGGATVWFDLEVVSGGVLVSPRVNYHVKTDQTGHYFQRGLPEGVYAVSVQTLNHVAGAEATITRGNTTLVNLALR